MPVIDVKLSRVTRGASEIFRILGIDLPEIIAAGLTVPGDKDAELSADEIEISFRKASEFDVGTKNLDIYVFANDYPKRSANLQSERVPQMQKELRNRLDAAGFPELTVSLYVHLGVGGYAEF